MTYQEFICNITERIQTIVGSRYQVKCHPVRKNNGVHLDGLMVMSEEANVSPTIYLNNYYDQYIHGRPLSEIIWEIVQLFKKAPLLGKIEIDRFSDFASVRDNIAIKLINYEANLDLLKEVPHRRFLDLAEVYYFVVPNELLGNATILIRNEHMELWQINETVLHRLGMRNTLYLGWEIRPMNLILRDYIREELDDYLKDKEPADHPAPDHIQMLAEEILSDIYQSDVEGPLYVLSNDQRFFGASCILYTARLKEFADLKDSDLYILPSSIHEVILIPQNVSPSYESLCAMVKEINNSEVEICDRLSDRVYKFDRETGEIS